MGERPPLTCIFYANNVTLYSLVTEHRSYSIRSQKADQAHAILILPDGHYYSCSNY